MQHRRRRQVNLGDRHHQVFGLAKLFKDLAKLTFTEGSKVAVSFDVSNISAIQSAPPGRQFFDVYGPFQVNVCPYLLTLVSLLCYLTPNPFVTSPTTSSAARTSPLLPPDQWAPVR